MSPEEGAPASPAKPIPPVERNENLEFNLDLTEDDDSVPIEPAADSAGDGDAIDPEAVAPEVDPDSDGLLADEDGIEGGEKPTEKPPEGQPQTVKFKTKIKGVEEDVELSVDDVRRDYQKWKASDQTFKEAAKTRKLNNQVIHMLRDPKTVDEILTALGHDTLKLADAKLQGWVDYQKMTPEQKENIDLKRTLAQRDAEAQQRAKTDGKTKEDAATEQMKTSLQAEVLEAMKGSKLPQTSVSFNRLGNQMRIHQERGISISAKEAERLAWGGFKSEVQHILKAMEPADILELLGDEGQKKARVGFMKKLKQPIVRKDLPPSAIKKPKRGWVTDTEFKQHMDRIKKM